MIYTSGSTGRPKGVVYVYRMALANYVNIGSCIDLRSTDTNVSFLPLFHTAGINLYATVAAVGIADRLGVIGPLPGPAALLLITRMFDMVLTPLSLEPIFAFRKDFIITKITFRNKRFTCTYNNKLSKTFK